MSRTASPVPGGPPTVWPRAIAGSVIIGACALTIAAFTRPGLKAFFAFAYRAGFFFATIYAIIFIFYGNGGRSVTETFLVSFSVISLTYFGIACPIDQFIGSLVLCAGVAGLFRFVG
jgi:hypothetical protein